MKVTIILEAQIKEPELYCDWNDPSEVEWFKDVVGKDLMLHSNEIGDSIDVEIKNIQLCIDR